MLSFAKKNFKVKSDGGVVGVVQVVGNYFKTQEGGLRVASRVE